MKDFSFLLQGIDENRDTFAALKSLTKIDGIQRLLLCVAFVNNEGVNLISNLIRPFADKTTMIIGINNGITSMQALDSLLDIGVKIWCIDTAAQDITFHPKTYMAVGKDTAMLVNGSANLTRGGIIGNIEASFCATFDLADAYDAVVVKDIEESFKVLLDLAGANAILVSDHDQVSKLSEACILEDESKRTSQLSTTSEANQWPRRPGITRITLRTRKIPRSGFSDSHQVPEMTISNPVEYSTNHAPINLIWRSRPLTRRDINLPLADGGNTHRTGSMLLKKGNFTMNDFRHYFREEAFANEPWSHSNPSMPHMEYCECIFDIFICGEDKGRYCLRLSHNSNKTSKAYLQKNSMTSLQWGDAISVVSDVSNLGRVLEIYSTNQPHHYQIRISDQ